MPLGCALVVGPANGIGAAVASRLEGQGWPTVTHDGLDAGVAGSVFQRLERERGPVRVLVIACPDDRDRDAAVAGTLELAQRGLASMRDSNFGRIVILAPAIGLSALTGLAANGAPPPGALRAGATRATLTALTRQLALEAASPHTTVNAVLPGVVGENVSSGKDIKELFPARRAATVDEVAACVGFLASADASYVTGAALRVDGALAA